MFTWLTNCYQCHSHDFLYINLAAWNNDCNENDNYFLCWLIINKPQPNLYSGNTYLNHEGVLWIDVPLYVYMIYMYEEIHNNNKFIQYYHFVRLLPIKITIINS